MIETDRASDIVTRLAPTILTSPVDRQSMVKPSLPAQQAMKRHAHSGQTLQLRSVGGKAQVCKTFHGDLERAKRCVDKQRLFRGIIAEGLTVRAASVDSFVDDGERAVLTMPYIDGHVGEDIALYAGRSLSRQLRGALSEVVYREMAGSELTDQPLLSIVLKLDEVVGRTGSRALHQILVVLRAKLRELPDTLQFPRGHCHGDLTLSNIIMAADHSVVLIDFLDTFLESPLQDVAKLIQEFDYGWSFRRSPLALQVRGELFLRESYPLAVHQFKAMYPMQTWLMSVLCLARIAPYTTDAETESWLMRSLQKAIHLQPASTS